MKVTQYTVMCAKKNNKLKCVLDRYINTDLGKEINFKKINTKVTRQLQSPVTVRNRPRRRPSWTDGHTDEWTD